MYVGLCGSFNNHEDLLWRKCIMYSHIVVGKPNSRVTQLINITLNWLQTKFFVDPTMIGYCNIAVLPNFPVLMRLLFRSCHIDWNNPTKPVWCHPTFLQDSILVCLPKEKVFFSPYSQTCSTFLSGGFVWYVLFFFSSVVSLATPQSRNTWEAT